MPATAHIIELSQRSFYGKLRKPKNKDVRAREYLTPDEVEQLMMAAGRVGRHPHRDKALILLAYRHALRVSELVALKWSQVDLKTGQLHVSRLKGGISATHPLRGVELRALRKLQRDYPATPYVFVSERGASLTTSAIRKILSRAGKTTLPFPVHPHMLRHACGFYLANQGNDTRSIQIYMGHQNIQHTCRYTELAAKRFEPFWQD